MAARVFTVEGLVDEITPLIESVMTPWLEKNSVNMASLLMVAMNIVETFSTTIAKMSGSDKLKTAKMLLPKLIDFATEKNKLEKTDAEVLKSRLARGEDMVENIISVYTAIAKDPQIIQAVENVEEEAKSFCLRLFKK